MRFKFYALKLCGIIFLIFLAQVFISGFTDMFLLNKDAFGEYYRFVTSIFLHSGIPHLAYNLFALALFGSILEKLIGGKKFLIVFFVTGILANLVSVNFYSSSLGASGAIFGVIGALIFVRPLMVVWAFGMPMPIFIAGILWGAGDLLGAVGFFMGNPIDNTGNNTGNIAHLSGMFFGFIFGIFYRERKIRRNKEKFGIDERTVRQWEDSYLR